MALQTWDVQQRWGSHSGCHYGFLSSDREGLGFLHTHTGPARVGPNGTSSFVLHWPCLLYTSDAADE